MNQTYTFLDLFAGCGGLSEGFYGQGFRAIAHVEKDQYACETLKKRMLHYGYNNVEKSVVQADITSPDILDKIKQVAAETKTDVIIGGPPCQSFSTLGRAKDDSSMKNDPRNYLFKSYVNILNKLKPKIFVFENVPGLMTAKQKSKPILNNILEELKAEYNVLGDIKTMLLNAADYGVPQIRKRIIIIGTRKDLSTHPEEVYNNIQKTHSQNASKSMKSLRPFVTVRDAIEELPKIKPGGGEVKTPFKAIMSNDYLQKIRPNGMNSLIDHVARTHNDEDRKRYVAMSKNLWDFSTLLLKKPELNHKKQRVFNNSYVVQFWDKPSRTIIAHLYKDGNQFIHPDPNQGRTLTPREAARLQSFPDNFCFYGSRTQQFKQIGNAVPPLMANAIAKSIKTILRSI